MNLWLGMRPADIFVFVFLPPFLLDLAVRIDFYMLKKNIVNIMFMAFTMVIFTCLVLVPFMLYGLDLKWVNHGTGWVLVVWRHVVFVLPDAYCGAVYGCCCHVPVAW